MRRHAKAPSAGSTSGTGSSRRLFGRAFATRGGSSGADGSGAPTGPARSRVVLLLAALAITALLVASAGAAPKFVRATFGSNGSGDGQFETAGGVAVNQASNDVYVQDVGGNRVERFDADGAYLSQFGAAGSGNGEFAFNFSPSQIAVAPDGSVYVADSGNNRIQKFDAAGVYQSQFGTAGSGNGEFSGPTGVAVAPDGSVYVADSGNNRIQKFDAAGVFQLAFGADVDPGGGTGAEVCTAPTVCQVGVSGSGNGEFSSPGPGRVAVDSTGAVYVLEQFNRVQKFDATGAFLSVFAPGALTLFPRELAIDRSNDHVLAAQFSADFSSTDIVELDSSGVLQDTHNVPGSPTGLDTESGSGTIYEADGFSNRVLIIGATTQTATMHPTTDVGFTTATLNGAVDPDGVSTGYHFEYSKDGSAWTSIPTSDADAGEGEGEVAVAQSLTELDSNTLYHARLVATTQFGAKVTSTETTFTTGAVPPNATTLSTSQYGSDTATLAGRVNPRGSATTYHFEYGLTNAYGSQAPASDQPVGSGNGDQPVFAEISDLQPETTYHYRVVATSPEGTANGADTTFTTRTVAGAVPDRAYEMVTPPFKAIRSGGSLGTGPYVNANPGVPSQDGESIAWGNSFFPLDDSVRAPSSGDRRLLRRTSGSWTSTTRNTAPYLPNPIVPFSFNSVAFLRLEANASSADLETTTWYSYGGSEAGKAELVPTEGKIGTRMYTRRDGTGVEGWNSWLSNPEKQRVVEPDGRVGLGFFYAAQGETVSQINDSGSAVARSGLYRGVAEDPATAVDDDPSDSQQLTSSFGGRTTYVQRGATPSQLPTAPKELVNGCTGTVAAGDQTLIPARIGTGAVDDTIGTRPCQEWNGVAAAAGTATRTVGSSTLIDVSTDTGEFAVGQLFKSDGTPTGAIITEVGSGTLTLNKEATCGGAAGSGDVTEGSILVTDLTTNCGEFTVGQTISMTAVGVFGPGTTHTTTIVAVDSQANTLTLAAPPPSPGFAAFWGSPQRMTVATGVSSIESERLAVTSSKGAVLGSSAVNQGGSGIAPQPMTALANDGQRIFFQSPDKGPIVDDPAETPTSGCAPATGAGSLCVPQLYVRQYDSNGNPVVRWISRAQGIGAQRVDELGRGAFFEGASKDGRYVYFKTNSPLLPSDPNGGISITDGVASESSYDLYRYELPASRDADPAGGTLTRISGGPAGTADPSTNNSSSMPILGGLMPPGEGGVLRYHSADGKLAYFLTTSPIDGAAAAPPQGGTTVPGGTVGNGSAAGGTRDLYLFDDRGSSPQWRFVAQIPWSMGSSAKLQRGADALNFCASFDLGVSSGWAAASAAGLLPLPGNCFRGTPDGKQITFFTRGRLTADDTDDAGDIYLYDVERDELTRVTAPPAGVAPYPCNISPTGESFGGLCNADLGISLPGIGFTSEDAGNAGAGSLESARGWNGGRYYNMARNAEGEVSVFFATKSNLVAEDDDELGHYDVYEWRDGELTLLTPRFPEEPYFYSGNSLDGQDIFVQTPARIDPREIDGGDLDIYDLRIGGGFPYTPPAEPCDVLAHRCRDAVSQPPIVSGVASVSAGSAGNVQKPRSKPKCRKGQVRRKGHCVRKKAKQAQRTAGRTGRASR